MELQIVDFGKCSPDAGDVSYEDLMSVGKCIYDSFATLGFVYLTNTGISDLEAAEYRDLVKAFFSLDAATKTKYRIDENGFGYVCTGAENANPNKPGDFKECFDITGPGLISAFSKWPDTEINGFSTSLKNFMERLKDLAMRIFDALAAGMDLMDENYFRKCHSRVNNVRNFSTLRNLYYAKYPETYVAKEGEMRLGEHTDWGSMTILFQDDAGGLQVQRSDGEYIEAKPIPGTVLVNIGDALEFWTRGRLRSTKHRIQMPDIFGEENVERSSMVYFVRPDNEVIMSEIGYGNSTGGNGRRLEEDLTPITVLQHLQKKYSEANMPPPRE